MENLLALNPSSQILMTYSDLVSQNVIGGPTCDYRPGRLTFVSERTMSVLRTQEIVTSSNRQTTHVISLVN